MMITTSGQSNLTKKPHRRRRWTDQSYSAGCANVHLHLTHASFPPGSIHKQHFDRFVGFCRAHYYNRPTDHASPSVTVKRKGKEEYLYIAFLHQGTHKALRHGSHSFTCKQYHACLSFVAFTRCHHHSNGHPIAAHYSFIDPDRMKG